MLRFKVRSQDRVTYNFDLKSVEQTHANTTLSTSSSMTTAGLGVPVKLLHESLGHIVTVELKTGQLYRGKLAEGRICHACRTIVLIISLYSSRGQFEHIVEGYHCDWTRWARVPARSGVH